MSVAGNTFSVGDFKFELNRNGRVVVTGAGKAAGQMAIGLLDIVAQAGFDRDRISGWINVPDDGVCDASPLTVFGCRPAGENLPTERAIEGTREIIRLVRGLEKDDLSLCLISGGGSALLSMPVEGISLDDKRQLIRFLDSSGASIEDRNRIRRELSQVKGGRLAQMQTQGTMVTLLISDILGDPGDLIASGPTVPTDSDPVRAVELLNSLIWQNGGRDAVPRSVWAHLQQRIQHPDLIELCPQPNASQQIFTIGNIATAVDAAAIRSRALGYQVETRIQSDPSESVTKAATMFSEWILNPAPGPRILIDGGEPVVRLCSNPGRGGRNQQLVLEVANRLIEATCRQHEFCFLSGGTDGEDGNTPVAGASFDHELVQGWNQQGVKPFPYLSRNDAYSFFERSRGLFLTGMTGTNVGDLRIAIVR